MYKLFINNKRLFLCQNPAQIKNLMNDNFIVEPYVDRTNFSSILKIILNNNNPNDVILFHKEVKVMFEEVCSFFKCIEAAGGVVYNHFGEILLIHRRGFWDLPKGKIDKGETIEQAAIREVIEETGLQQVNIIKPIRFNDLQNIATYHSYFIGEKLALKISHWFVMETTFEGKLIPQSEEDIEQAIWVKIADIPEYFGNMYTSIIDVLSEI